MWRCSSYRKNACKSRLVTYGKVVKVTNGEHNHPPIHYIPSENCKKQFSTVIIKKKEMDCLMVNRKK